jgi:DNA (cytosine-5)-methyltransferase 1
MLLRHASNNTMRMIQSEILSFARSGCAQARRMAWEGEELKVFDLFCGAGGFSEGAKQAGCRVVFACDSDSDALDVHAANHPDCVHKLVELPCDDIPFPVDGSRFHVHGSPPCQAVSSAGTKDSVRVGDALCTISWFIETAITCGASSWSMEQVPASPVIRLLESFRRMYTTRISFSVFDFSELGVPQRRKRVIAGNPQLVASLLRYRCCEAKLSIQNAIAEPLGTHIRNTNYSSARRKRQSTDPARRNGKFVYKRARIDQSCYPVTGPSPTILALRSSGHWINFINGVPHKTELRIQDIAALQTFPVDYAFDKKNAIVRRLIGNAVPPKVAAVLLRKRVKASVLCSPKSPSYVRQLHTRV